MKRAIPYYLDEFLEYCEIEKGLSSITVKNYQRFLERFFQWLKENNLQKITPSQLTEDHIQEYGNWLSRVQNATHAKDISLSRSTQIRYLIAVRVFLLYFHAKKIPSLSADKIKLPKAFSNRNSNFLSLDQIEKLLSIPNTNTVTGIRDRAILETLFSTGLRVSQLVSLNRSHYEMASHQGDLEIGDYKKDSRVFITHFSNRTLSWLKKYLDVRDNDDEALFIRFKGPTSASKRLTIRGIELVVNRYAKESGIPFLITPNTLRQSYAVYHISFDTDFPIIKKLFCHQNISTTQVYTHVTNRRLRDVHRKFHGGRNFDKD